MLYAMPVLQNPLYEVNGLPDPESVLPWHFIEKFGFSRQKKN